ncbi:MAG: hypothetical protein HGA27_00510 [Peptococcaceae bacterium]|nr:hypothetical protein [Peptococcaceae bacterium]
MREDKDNHQVNQGIRAKIRLDFKGSSKPGRFFKGKPVEKIAEDIRELNIATFRNIPLKGIKVSDIDIGSEVYVVYDEINNLEIAYAPIVLDVTSDTLEDLLVLIARDDFRKVEVVAQEPIVLSRIEAERLLYRVADEISDYRESFERKYNR